MFGHFTTLCTKGLKWVLQKFHAIVSLYTPWKYQISGIRWFKIYFWKNYFREKTQCLDNLRVRERIQKNSIKILETNVVPCAIWYDLYNLNNVKNLHVTFSKVAGFSFKYFTWVLITFLPCVKGYLHYKNIFCNKVALDV